MNIGDAIKALREGHDVYLLDLHLVPCREGRKILPHALVLKGDKVENWVPTQEQLYSEGWEIIWTKPSKP